MIERLFGVLSHNVDANILERLLISESVKIAEYRAKKKNDNLTEQTVTGREMEGTFVVLRSHFYVNISRGVGCRY